LQRHLHHVPRDKHVDGREHGIMDQAQYEKSIDEVVALGAQKVVLTGFGEPLLDKRLEKKVAYAASKGLSTTSSPNASALTPGALQGLLEAGLGEMRGVVLRHEPRHLQRRHARAGLRAHEGEGAGLPAAAGSRDGRQQARADVLPRAEGEPADTGPLSRFWNQGSMRSRSGSRTIFGDGRDYRERLDDSKKTTCGRPENGPLQIQWNGEVIPCCYDYNNQIILATHSRRRCWKS